MLDYIGSLDNAAEELQGLSDMIGYLGQIIREYTDEKGIYFLQQSAMRICCDLKKISEDFSELLASK